MDKFFDNANQKDDLNQTEKNNDEEDVSFCELQIEDDMEEKLIKFGVNRRNVRTLIREVYNNSNIKEILQSDQEGFEQANVPISRNLRSATKKSEEENPFFIKVPTFNEMSLCESDDDDDEYQPNFETSDVNTSTPLNNLDQSSSSTSSNETNDEAENKICERTRSKHHVNEEELQQANNLFVDLTPDISQNYDNSDNKDNTFTNWMRSDLWETKVSGTLNLTESESEDSINDPDFNFLAQENDEDSRHSTTREARISKVELKSLLKESKMPVNYSGVEQTKRLSQLSQIQKSNTVKEKLSKIRLMEFDEAETFDDEPVRETPVTSEKPSLQPQSSQLISDTSLAALFGDFSCSSSLMNDFNISSTSPNIQVSLQTSEDQFLKTQSQFSKAEASARPSTDNMVTFANDRPLLTPQPRDPHVDDVTQQPNQLDMTPRLKVAPMTSSDPSEESTSESKPLLKRSKNRKKTKKVNKNEMDDEKKMSSSGGPKEVKSKTRKSMSHIKLHNLHPALRGKQFSANRDGDSDSLATKLMQVADTIRPLEENTMIQNDVTKNIKDKLFAQGYIKRVQMKLLPEKPKLFTSFIKLLCDFSRDQRQSPVDLVKKARQMLLPYPEFIQGLAPFLLPQQAAACGLLNEHLIYNQVRTFLRGVECRYQHDQATLDKILNIFTSIAYKAEYSIDKIKSVILNALKFEPYLQEQFRMLFDEERPPVSRLHGESEAVFWNDNILDNKIEKAHEMVTLNDDGNFEAANPSIFLSDSHRKSMLQKQKKRAKPTTSGATKERKRKTVEETDLKKPAKKKSSSTIEASPQSLPQTQYLPENRSEPLPKISRQSESVSDDLSPTRTFSEESIIKPSFYKRRNAFETSSDESSLSKDSLSRSNPPPKVWSAEEDMILMENSKHLYSSTTDDAFIEVSKEIKCEVFEARQRFDYLMKILKAKFDDENTSSEEG